MKTTRYTIDLDQTFDATLSALSEERGVSKAEIIRNAVASYNYLTGQAPKNSDRKISITGNDDQVIKDVVLP